MRVDAINQIYGSYKSKTTAKPNQVEKAKGKDKVEFSSFARDYATIQKKMSETPDVREDLVADIKQRIQNNTYNVSAKDVASKILTGYRS